MHNHQVGLSRKDVMCGRLDSRPGEIIMNVEEDRLSSLPDDLIHEILSFVSMRQAIRTCVLSSRWKFIWTSMPYLNFSNEDFFPNFVSNVLSHRNNQRQVSSVKLVPRGPVSQESIKKILNYTLSHNVQQLSVKCLAKNIVQFPLSFKGTQTWDLPALTTLHLDNVTLYKCTGLFSKFTNLKTLSLSQCRTRGTNVLSISLPQLSDLTLSNLTLECTPTPWCLEDVNVVAPLLKNLAVIGFSEKHRMMVSAPGLSSLVMKSDRLLKLCIDGLRSVEKVDLCIYYTLSEDAGRIISLLQQLRSVKLLTLNLKILEVLSSSTELSSHQPYPFRNVKILNFTTSFPVMVCLEVQAQEKVTSPELKNYDSPPRDMFTMVSNEEIRVIQNIKSAKTLLEDLRRMVKSKNSNNKKAHMERLIENTKRKMHEHDKSQVKEQWAHSTLELQWHFKMMSEIEQGKLERLLTKMPTSETRYMAAWLPRMILCSQNFLSSLQCIEGLLTELPASKRALMQATFSTLFEHPAILTNNVLGLDKDLMHEVMTG